MARAASLFGTLFLGVHEFGFEALSFEDVNVWCAELEWMVHSEFCDGNVPACFENLRVFLEAFEMLPEGGP